MRHILITGGAGFIGSHLADELQDLAGMRGMLGGSFAQRGLGCVRSFHESFGMHLAKIFGFGQRIERPRATKAHEREK